MKTLLIGTIALCAVSGLAGSASAEDDEYEVYYDRALLQAPDGAARLHDQLEDQADDICRDVLYGTYSLTAQRKCEMRVVDIAIEEIGDRQLTALHDAEVAATRYSENR